VEFYCIGNELYIASKTALHCITLLNSNTYTSAVYSGKISNKFHKFVSSAAGNRKRNCLVFTRVDLYLYVLLGAFAVNQEKNFENPRSYSSADKGSSLLRLGHM